MGESGEPRSEEQKRLDARLEAEERESAALRSRLGRLSADLNANENLDAGKGKKDAGFSAGPLGEAVNLGFRVLAEFVSAVVVGALIGWLFDKWFGTSPLFLLVFILLGTAAGFWSVYRIAVKPRGPRA